MNRLVCIVAFFCLSSGQTSVLFSEKEVTNEVLIMAITLQAGRYSLMVSEQYPGRRKCWDRSDYAGVKMHMLDFNFSGSCSRAMDSNGYSFRLNGEDKSMDYLLLVVEGDTGLRLIAKHVGPFKMFEIGRTKGITHPYNVFTLAPSCRITKRTYGKKVLGHYYFSCEF